MAALETNMEMISELKYTFRTDMAKLKVSYTSKLDGSVVGINTDISGTTYMG